MRRLAVTCLAVVVLAGCGIPVRTYCDGPNKVYKRGGQGVAVSPNDPSCRPSDGTP